MSIREMTERLLAGDHLADDWVEPVFVRINNVFKWFYEVNTQEEYELAEDFPTLLLPWSDVVFESTYIPRFSNSEGEIVMGDMYGRFRTYTKRVVFPSLMRECSPQEARKGIMEGFMLRVGHEMYPQIRSHDTLQQAKEKVHLTYRESQEVTHFVVYCAGYEFSNIDDQWAGAVGIYTDKQGRPLTKGLTINPIHKAAPGEVYAAILASNFIQCRNVKVIDEPLSRQRRRQLERKGGIRYKTIDIDLFAPRRKNRSSGEGPATPGVAVHSCRASWATYTEDNPAFGQPWGVGTWWRKPSIKGLKAYGTVIKDYETEGEMDETPQLRDLED